MILIAHAGMKAASILEKKNITCNTVYVYISLWTHLYNSIKLNYKEWIEFLPML